MAEFCTFCAPKLDFPIDIDLEDLFNGLTPGNFLDSFICEGCSLLAIAKTADGIVMFAGGDDTIWKTEKEYFGAQSGKF